MPENGNRKASPFGNLLYDVEHALGMHAYSFVQFPAFAIYDKEVLAQFSNILMNCHIYLIGFLPKVDLVDVSQRDRLLVVTLSALGEKVDISWPLPDGFNLKEDGEAFFVETDKGERVFPSMSMLMSAYNAETGKYIFDVQYIGQAYGQEGERNAVDRLVKHETLQKISVQGVPDGYSLELLLLEVAPSNTLFTMFNPHAENSNDGEKRIVAGLDKLFGTDERERIALYEASLIRYFQPKYNKEFKDSFPSTNMKILADCYDKDFSAVVAEICIDELPYMLKSTSVEPKLYHIAQHDLHTDEQRKAFFSGN